MYTLTLYLSRHSYLRLVDLTKNMIYVTIINKGLIGDVSEIQINVSSEASDETIKKYLTTITTKAISKF